MTQCCADVGIGVGIANARVGVPDKVGVACGEVDSALVAHDANTSVAIETRENIFILALDSMLIRCLIIHLIVFFFNLSPLTNFFSSYILGGRINKI